MAFTVRPMSASDRTDWAAMRRELWDNLSVEEHLDEIDHMLVSGQWRGYLALSGTGRPAGFAEVSIRDYANGAADQPVPFLEGIWVDGAFRRQGAGQALIDALSRDAAAEGFRELCSDADIANHASHAAHARWGFAETERVVYFRKAL